MKLKGINGDAEAGHLASDDDRCLVMVIARINDNLLLSAK